ncbi:MAG TPA: hypothetical protein PKY38_00760 [Opitutaceae bacterium]|nr:hypothetical protein [Opitutaceae bacterium]
MLIPQSPLVFRRILWTYFRSGWAFLIPYLIAYLLYAWLDLPVNPVGAGSMENGAGQSISESDFLPSSFSFLPSPPSLLHVYWALHAIHVMMAGVALWHWWRDRASGLKLNAYHLPLTAYRLPLSALAPWLLLALLFFIPGLYLEWPSDPWEHLRRINEWHAHSLVTEHSAWKKSSYFLPYSLTGFTTGLTQLSWLNVYYTAVCLLLSWQYYRLARAVGLGERAAFIFVILQALLMGNNVFSFYRYYGLSSSIFAQLGAVALTRIALEFAGRRASLDPSFGHKEAQKVTKDSPSPSAYRPPLSAYRPVLRSFSEGGYSLIASVPALLALTAFNHPQGLGIAGLGVLAVIVWRLIEWKRSMIGWLALAASLASVATVLWFPRHPAIDEIYRPEGWLNAWYGFNLFSTSSPAFERSLHILGAFGALNLILGLWLIVRRNHVVGWLTLMPVLALALPCFALPFAHVVVSQTHAENIVTFHRFLLAVPLGLAAVAAFSRSGFAYTPAAYHGVASSPSSPAALPRDPRPSYRMTIATAGLPCALLLALCFSPGSSAYNRLWHSLQVTPDDLALRHFTAVWTPENRALAQAPDTLLIGHPMGAKVQEAFSPSPYWYRFRPIHDPIPVSEIEHRLDWLRALSPEEWKASETDASQSWQIFARIGRDDPSARLHVDFTTSNTPWMSLGGSGPKFTFASGQLVISNPLGAASYVFNPELIPVDHSKRYRLTSSLRQTGDSAATNYLAVVWYDRDGRLLQSHAPQPEGAGAPVGWSNGTYSYYGLTSQPAPPEWTAYTITFGLGEPVAIPANAAYFRIGALLNYSSTPDTVVELTRGILKVKLLHENMLIVFPGREPMITHTSQTAQLSRHWQPQQAAWGYGGSAEILRHLLPKE